MFNVDIFHLANMVLALHFALLIQMSVRASFAARACILKIAELHSSLLSLDEINRVSEAASSSIAMIAAANAITPVVADLSGSNHKTARRMCKLALRSVLAILVDTIRCNSSSLEVGLVASALAVSITSLFRFEINAMNRLERGCITRGIEACEISPSPNQLAWVDFGAVDIGACNFAPADTFAPITSLIIVEYVNKHVIFAWH